MTFSGLTGSVRRSSMHSPRQGARVDTLLLHHAATVSAAVVVGMMVSGSRTVSANYVCGNDGHLYGVVDEEYRAWTSGSGSDGGKGAAWDRRSITVETANESAGGSWPISERSYATLGALAADLHRRYGLVLDRNHVLGHRDLWTRYRASYATACPGGMDLDKVIAIARGLVGQGAVVPVGAGNPVAIAPAYVEAAPVKEYQELLIKKGFPVGATGADGIKGPATTNAIVRAQRAAGLTADGLVGPNTLGWLRGGSAPAPNALDVDGVWGEQTTRRLQAILGVAVDGKLGPQTWKALQRRIGTTADGIFGPNSKGALQRFLGVPDDRVVGPITVRALQRRLNTGAL